MQNKVIFNNDGTNMTFRSYVSKVFVYVALGLLVSGVFSFIIGTNEQILYFIYSIPIFGVFFPMIVEIAIAIYFSRRLITMSKQTAYVCYFLYSILTGVSLASIFSIYRSTEIMFAFASTAVLFICMSILGRNTNLDLTKASSYLSFGLIGIIIATALNLFIFKSSSLDLIISYIAIIIFLVLIAYDMQKLRNLYNSGMSDGDLYDKLLIFGSFQLYLDFVNLFLQILRVFSKRRD